MNGNQEQEHKDHSIALWAALTALFTNLAAVAVVDIIGSPGDKRNQALAAVITSLIVGAGVYSKQRWDDAKVEREHAKSPNGGT